MKVALRVKCDHTGSAARDNTWERTFQQKQGLRQGRAGQRQERAHSQFPARTHPDFLSNSGDEVVCWGKLGSSRGNCEHREVTGQPAWAASTGEPW